MNKIKYLILVLAFLSLFNFLEAQKLDFNPKVGRQLNQAPKEDHVNIRNLLSAPNTWMSQSAVVYSGPDFGGVPSTILSGFPLSINSKYVSFEVGAGTSMRIVDWENMYVYRFEAGRVERRFEIDSNDWEATVDRPVPDDKCVMTFQYPRYHGYFKQYCVASAQNYYTEAIYCPYRSITFGTNLDLAVFTTTNGRSYLPLTQKRNFKGDFNRIYLLSSVGATSSYLISTTSAGNYGYYDFAAGYGNSPGGWTTIDADSYLMISGKTAYAKATGDAVSYVVSGNRPYRFFSAGEDLTIYVRNTVQSVSSNGIISYTDYEGFSTTTSYTYTVSSSYSFSSSMRSVSFGSSIQSVVLYMSSGYELVLGGGPIPSFYGASISNFCPVPAVDDDQVLFYDDPCFQGTERNLGALSQSGFYFTGSLSIVVGRNVRRFGFAPNNDAANNAANLDLSFRHIAPGAHSNFDLGAGHFFGYTDIYEYMSTYIDNDCLEIYSDSYTFNSQTRQTLCVTSPQSFTSINLSQTRLVVFPTTKSYSSVLLFKQSIDKYGETITTEMNLIGNTIFSDPISDVFDSITMIPNIPTGQVFLYTGTFYRGELYILTETSVISDFDTRTLQNVSGLFGSGAQLRFVDASSYEIITYTTTFYTFEIFERNIFIQAGYGDLINVQTGAIWMVDDLTNYSGFTVLTGRQFFDRSMVSSSSRYIMFPNDGSIQSVYMYDADGVRQDFDYQQGAAYFALQIGTDLDTFKGIDRMVSIPKDFNGVLLGTGPNFQRYLGTLGPSTVVKLCGETHYSIATPYVGNGLRIFDFERIGNNDWTPDQPKENWVATFDPDRLEDDFQAECGFYGFATGDYAPKSVLLHCVLVFPDCDYSQSMYKYCTKNYSYSKFDIPYADNIKQLGIVISQPIEGSKEYRSYSGIHVGGQFIDKTKCISVSGDRVEAYFKR